MAKPDSPDVFNRLLQAANARRRSSQFQWMYENHAAFAEVLAKAGKPNWAELANEMAALGLRDRQGQPPTADATRLTWLRVRKAHERALAKTSATTSPPAQKAPRPSHSVVAPPPETDDGDDFPLPPLKKPSR